MADFVAFEAKFFGAFERVVTVLTTENTVQSFALVWTFYGEVPKLFAVPTFNSWIEVSIVARYLSFQLFVVILLVRFIIT